MSLINDALKRANEQQSKPATSAEVSANLQPVQSPESDTPQFWQILCVVGLVGVAVWLGWAWVRGSNDSDTSRQVEVAARAFAPNNSTQENPSSGTAAQALSSALSPDQNSSSPAGPENGLFPSSGGNQADSRARNTPPAGEVRSTEALTALPDPVPLQSLSIPTQETPAQPVITSRTTSETAPTRPSVAASPVNEITSDSGSTYRHTQHSVEPMPTSFPKLILQGIYFRPSRPAAVINGKTVYVGDKVTHAKVLAIDKQEVTLQWSNEVRVLAFE